MIVFTQQLLITGQSGPRCLPVVRLVELVPNLEQGIA